MHMKKLWHSKLTGEDAKCELCNQSDETQAHILLECNHSNISKCRSAWKVNIRTTIIDFIKKNKNIKQFSNIVSNIIDTELYYLDLENTPNEGDFSPETYDILKESKFYRLKGTVSPGWSKFMYNVGIDKKDSIKLFKNLHDVNMSYWVSVYKAYRSSIKQSEKTSALDQEKEIDAKIRRLFKSSIRSSPMELKEILSYKIHLKKRWLFKTLKNQRERNNIPNNSIYKYFTPNNRNYDKSARPSFYSRAIQNFQAKNTGAESEPDQTINLLSLRNQGSKNIHSRGDPGVAPQEGPILWHLLHMGQKARGGGLV